MTDATVAPGGSPPRPLWPGAVPLALMVGVLAISTSAILARVAMGEPAGVLRPPDGAAAALAVAFWRCALGAGALAPLAWRAGRRAPVRLSRTRRRQLVGSGLALAVHFALFQGALALTTVASAVTLATMAPVFVALGAARFLDEPAGRRVLVGLFVTIVGALTIGVGDLSSAELGGRALVGDVMALASAVAVTGYLLAGRVARRDVPATRYSASVYAIAALTLLPVALATGVPLVGYDALVWLAIGGIVAGPQLLGHTVFNTLLSRLSATVIAVVVLSEPLGAALLAWLVLAETPARAFAIGAPLVLVGVLTAATDRGSRAATHDATPAAN